MVVTSLEPTAVVDAYAVIKLLSTTDPAQEIGIVVNNAHDASEAQLVFTQLEVAATAVPEAAHSRTLGFIAHDPAVREAVLVQRPIVDHLPQSPASRCFRILASRLSGMAPQGAPGLRLVAPTPVRPHPRRQRHRNAHDDHARSITRSATAWWWRTSGSSRRWRTGSPSGCRRRWRSRT